MRPKKMPRRSRGRLTNRLALAAALHRRRALELRLTGATFDQIAATVRKCHLPAPDGSDPFGAMLVAERDPGVPRAFADRRSAHRAVVRALRDLILEPADQVRRLELARLDRLLAAIAPAAFAGDPPAVDRVLRVMQRRAEMLGLDAPQRAHVEHAAAPGGVLAVPLPIAPESWDALAKQQQEQLFARVRNAE